MARRVFFSFHYDDVWRANQVRNSWLLRPGSDEAGFIDHADFEEVERKGVAAIKKWIDGQLSGTSVTVVLIGSRTSDREYVKYELEKSYERGNGILGIYIHNLKDSKGNTSTKGKNTFGVIGKDRDGNDAYLSMHFPCYDWVDDNGRENLGKWVEEAARKAGR